MSSEPTATWSPVEHEQVFRVPGRRNLAPQADIRSGADLITACPFCPGAGGAPTGSGVRLVPSKHPMIALKGPGSLTQEQLHWVVVYGSSHSQRLGDLPATVTQEFLELVSRKTSCLFDQPSVKAVFAFESVGDHFGPTVAHPHGQVVGLPFIPRRLTLARAAESCAVCDSVIRQDLTVMITSHALVQVPAWSRLPFEMIILPRAHRPDLAALSAEETTAMAGCLHTGLQLCRLTHGGEMPPYLINVMQAPSGDTSHHLRIELVPLHKDERTLKRPGGMELGLGIYLNPLLPEVAAGILREVLPGARRYPP
jgi:UDPglucose--hexose-1-phosphate uridylyltransferase